MKEPTGELLTLSNQLLKISVVLFFYLLTKSDYLTSGAQCKMKVQGPFK